MDELGAIDAELAPFKGKIKRAETLRSAIRGAFSESPAESCFTVAGKTYSALVGPRGNESTIDKAQLLELVGAAKFSAIASVSLKSIQEQCAPEIAGAVVSMRLSGVRSLVLSSAPAAAVAAAPAGAKGKTSAKKR